MYPHFTSTTASAEIVIPDCCNIGVVFRAMLFVNAVILASVLAQATDWWAGLLDFVESSMLIEPICLSSLFALCGVRRLLVYLGILRLMPLWRQRGLCVLVPIAVSGLFISGIMSLTWFPISLTPTALHKTMALAALFAIVLQHYFELRIRAFSPALVEARLQALQARIRPHFLFNSLNAVLSLIRIEPQRAETTLEDLADLFRVLMRDPRSMTSVEDEIRLCEQYLSIEKIRLGERLQVRWEIDHSAGDVLHKAQIPVLLLQPLLENAVHYGVEPSAEPALVQICLRRFIDRVEVVIVNPYHGDAVISEGNQMALDNIRERLMLLYDVEAQLTTTIAREHFEVRLRFPFVKG